GAGGQHACKVADALGIRTIFVHPLAGVLSAYGMGLADLRALRERTVEATLAPAAMPEIVGTLDALAADAAGELTRQGVAPDRVTVLRRLHVRYEGTDTPLEVPFGDIAAVKA